MVKEPRKRRADVACWQNQHSLATATLAGDKISGTPHAIAFLVLTSIPMYRKPHRDGKYPRYFDFEAPANLPTQLFIYNNMSNMHCSYFSRTKNHSYLKSRSVVVYYLIPADCVVMKPKHLFTIILLPLLYYI